MGVQVPSEGLIDISDQQLSTRSSRLNRRGQRLLCSWGILSYCQPRRSKAVPQPLKIGTGRRQVRQGHLGPVNSVERRMQGVQKIWRSKVL